MHNPDHDNISSGWAEIKPEQAYAREEGTWEVVYHCGSQILKAGSRIRIFPPFTFNAQHNSGVRWTFGSVSAVSDADIELSVECIDALEGKHKHYTCEVIEVVIRHGALVAPQFIKVVIGDQRNEGKPAVAQWLSGPDMPFYIAVDHKGDEEFRKLARSPRIQVLGNTPERLICIGPSTVKAGEKFKLRVKAEDKHTNISSLYSSPIKIKPDDKMRGPTDTVISPYDEGKQQISDFSMTRPGISRIEVKDEKYQAISPPISTEFTEDKEKIFWGDIHAHTELGDGIGSENRFYEYARDEAWLDFTAISEHGGGDKWWGRCVNAARKYYDPGRFVTLLGYEWRWQVGHACVYGKDLELPVHSQEQKEDLFKLIRKGNAIMIPHHTNDPILTNSPVFKWPDYEKDLIQVAEICQMRGSFEKDEVGKDHVLFGGFGSSIQNGLACGHKFGFIGGTDNHCGRTGSPMYVGFSSGTHVGSAGTWRLDKMKLNRTLCGLTAVFAEELTRESIFSALRKRRCYATTGARILLNFKVNNICMGEEGMVSKPAKIYIRVAGTDTLETITIVRNNEDIYQLSCDSLDQEITWEDPEAPRKSFYYVRVKQKDGHMAWSSPVWCG